MGMVVNLGLERFHDTPEPIIAILEKLVGGRCTTCVREVFGGFEHPLDNARVVEVDVNGTRWLDAKSAKPILDTFASLSKGKVTSDSYSWKELEEIGVYNVQELALRLDGTEPYLGEMSIDLTPGRDVRLIDLEKSRLNWPEDSIAFLLHEVALEHRLIVHSA
jgi:hypothetical protein